MQRSCSLECNPPRPIAFEAEELRPSHEVQDFLKTSPPNSAPNRQGHPEGKSGRSQSDQKLIWDSSGVSSEKGARQLLGLLKDHLFALSLSSARVASGQISRLLDWRAGGPSTQVRVVLSKFR
jgi:hypothetical protein